MEQRRGGGQDESQALVFLLGEGRFAIDILEVQEIRGADRATPIPSAPPYFKGVTNLREDFIPVVDLRVKLGIAAPHEATGGVTIILRTGEHRVGVVVDGVCEVLSIASGAVKPPPSQYASSFAFVRGFVAESDGTVVLLDTEALLRAEGLALEDLMKYAESGKSLASGPSG